MQYPVPYSNACWCKPKLIFAVSTSIICVLLGVVTYKTSVSLALIALSFNAQLSLILLPIVPLQAASPLYNEDVLKQAGSSSNNDPCAAYRSQFSAMQSGSVATDGAKTLSNGIRVVGEFSQPTRFDRAAVERMLGIPSSVQQLPSGASRLVYTFEQCGGEILLDQSGVVRTAVLAPKMHVNPIVASAKMVEQRSVTQQRIQKVEQTRRIAPTTPVREPELRKSRGGLAKKIIISTLVLAGIGAAVYYGGHTSGSGPCNVPSDRAADGSRCGDRAASVRPGGRP